MALHQSCGYALPIRITLSVKSKALAGRPLVKLLSRMFPDATLLEAAAESLCATARWCYTQGWVPATSGNFSVRVDGRILVTASPGLDRGTLTPAGLLEVDLDGRMIHDSPIGGTGKPSAETGLHLVLYRARPSAGAILHVHTVWNTLISARFAAIGYVSLEGYEILKGLSGVATHAGTSSEFPSSKTRRITTISPPALGQRSTPIRTRMEFYLAAMGFILGDNRWPRLAATLRLSSFFSRSKSGASRQYGLSNSPPLISPIEEFLWQFSASPVKIA